MVPSNVSNLTNLSLQGFLIGLVFVIVSVFWLARSCVLTIPIRCFKVHKSPPMRQLKRLERKVGAVKCLSGGRSFCQPVSGLHPKPKTKTFKTLLKISCLQMLHHRENNYCTVFKLDIVPFLSLELMNLLSFYQIYVKSPYIPHYNESRWLFTLSNIH